MIKEIKKPEPPKGDAKIFSFIMKNQDQDLLAHISIMPPHTDIEELTPKDCQIKEVVIGKPMVETKNIVINMILEKPTVDTTNRSSKVGN